MSAHSGHLGGRLPLLDPTSMNESQRKLYDRVIDGMVRWADDIGFQSRTADGRLIGPFNPCLFSPEIASAFLDLQEAEQEHTTLGDRVRQVVILAVGAVWNAPYELYAHSAAARRAGIPDVAIRALATGEVADGLSAEETVAYRYARQLAAEHHVPAALYQEAERSFRARGLVDIALLAGIYHTVCGLLSGFDIPSPERLAPAAASASGKQQPQLTLVARFPTNYFLENLAIRRDHSVLVTVVNQNELWYVPPTNGALPVEPSLLYKFDQNVTAIVETGPDVFHICTGNMYTTHEAFLHRLELRGWSLGAPLHPEVVTQFPGTARGPNGAC